MIREFNLKPNVHIQIKSIQDFQRDQFYPQIANTWKWVHIDNDVNRLFHNPVLNCRSKCCHGLGEEAERRWNDLIKRDGMKLSFNVHTALGCSSNKHSIPCNLKLNRWKHNEHPDISWRKLTRWCESISSEFAAHYLH